MDVKKIFDQLLENQTVKKLVDITSRLGEKAYEVVKDPAFATPSADKINEKDLLNTWLLPASLFPTLGWFFFSLAKGNAPFSSLILKLPFVLLVFLSIPYCLGFIAQILAKRFGGDFDPTFGSKLFTLICLPLYLSLIFALVPILKIIPLLIGLYTFYIAYTAISSKDYVPYNEKNMFIVGLLGCGFLFVIMMQELM